MSGKRQPGNFSRRLFRSLPSRENNCVHEKAKNRGVFALKDQIRPEAKAVVEELNALGVQTAMLTGDQPETAAAIAREAGLKSSFQNAFLTESRGSEKLKKHTEQSLWWETESMMHRP
ncbi:HAD family hydrolase [Bacillus licheniformis]|nr:HAD family hydrolase [Bacillus licheniformis]